MTSREPDQKAEGDLAWYRRTGHCGGCGQPGTYCLCTPRNRCGCSTLHEMGSGRVDDALDQFVPPIGENQGELFA